MIKQFEHVAEMNKTTRERIKDLGGVLVSQRHDDDVGVEYNGTAAKLWKGWTLGWQGQKSEGSRPRVECRMLVGETFREPECAEGAPHMVADGSYLQTNSDSKQSPQPQRGRDEQHEGDYSQDPDEEHQQWDEEEHQDEEPHEVEEQLEKEVENGQRAEKTATSQQRGRDLSASPEGAAQKNGGQKQHAKIGHKNSPERAGR